MDKKLTTSLKCNFVEAVSANQTYEAGCSLFKIGEKSVLNLLSAEEYAVAKPFFLDFKINQLWSCNADNPASAAVAKRIGFQEDRKYLFLRWGTH